MSLRQCGRGSLLKIIPLRLTHETTGAYTLKVWVGKSSICPISNRPNPLVLYLRGIIHDRLTILINRESSIEICEVLNVRENDRYRGSVARCAVRGRGQSLRRGSAGESRI